jgi:alpha/beta superfamily hydrolase
MKKVSLAAILLVTLAGCLGEPTPVQEKISLVQARAGFKTKLAPRGLDRDPLPDPPKSLFRKVTFDSPVGKLEGYLGQTAPGEAKHPAIIWITGGDCNSIDDVWSDSPPENDQTASAFRKAGIVMFFPSLRGGNQNPGAREGLLGEVDDVVAAADFLAGEPSVDKNRIYLGGHSTGGTLVLLVAECTDRFRAVFSFGPASDVGNYDPQYLPFDRTNSREIELRSPGRWLESIHGPTFVFEGVKPSSNIASLEAMAKATKNPMIHFLRVEGADHFSVLGPINALLAKKILADQGPQTNINFTAPELNVSNRN